jgi:hypothetical protein
MRLYELTGYKNQGPYPVAKQIFATDPGRNDTAKELQFSNWHEYITKQGFVKLGKGKAGVVYEKPGYPWVFKVFRNDPAFEYYFNYCKANQSNPHVPNLRGNLIKIGKNAYVMRMEKLTPIDEEFFDRIYDTINAMKIYKRYPIFSKERKTYTDMIKQLKKEYPQMYKIIVDMMNSRFALDLHYGNIMTRGNVPVIVDPIT